MGGTGVWLGLAWLLEGFGVAAVFDAVTAVVVDALRGVGGFHCNYCFSCGLIGIRGVLLLLFYIGLMDASLGHD